MAGRSVNNLVAKVVVTDLMLYSMDEKEVEHYVKKSLESEISKEIIRHMDIKKEKDVFSNTITYTGTLTGVASSSNYVTISSTNQGFNGTSSGYSQINLRVVEYTKNGKVTRVELQRYNELNDDWSKIPRIQIEE